MHLNTEQQKNNYIVVGIVIVIEKAITSFVLLKSNRPFCDMVKYYKIEETEKP
jgi:hypothetical protein